MLLTEQFHAADGNTKAVVPVRNLKEYLTQARVLEVPPWQREYSWQTTKEGQVDALLDDLLTFAKNDAVNEYLIGSVILCGDQSRPGKLTSLLIDGQQRTLTLSLFIMCARKFLQVHKLVDINKASDIELFNDLGKCVTSNAYNFTPKVSMHQENANAILHSIYDWSVAESRNTTDEIFNSADAQTLTQRNLADVAKFIYTQLETDGWDSNKLVAWLEKIINGVKLIELELSNEREAIAVYDRINNRGMQLNSADLVKNILFQQVADEEFLTISDSWKAMVAGLNECEKRVRMQEPKYLLRALAASHSGKKIPYDDLVTFWVNRLNGTAKEVDEDGKEVRIPAISPIEFANTLALSAAKLAELAKNRCSFGDLKEIYLAAELGSVQHFAVLLAGYDIESEDVFRHLASQVNARTMLYILGKERTQTFESLVPIWAKKISDLGPEATIASVNAVFKDCALPAEELWQNLESQVLAWSYQNATEKRKIRSVIAYLSSHLDKKRKKPLSIVDAMRTTKKPGETAGWDLDHVMPQKIDKSKEFQKIGNLVLLCPRDNRSMKDADPSLKGSWYNQCEIGLTKTLSDVSKLNDADQKIMNDLFDKFSVNSALIDLNNWTQSAVLERSKFYSSYFKEVLSSHMA